MTVFFGLGMGLSAVLVLMLAQWTTNTMNLIGGALDLAVTFPKLRRTVLMLIIAVIGTLFAINGMIERFAVFLSFLGTVVAPIAGVYLVDFYLLNKGEPLSIERAQQAAYRPAAIVAWCVGALVCFMTSAEFLNLFSLTTISVLDGTLAAAVSYLGLSKLTLKAPVAEAAR